MYGYIYKTTNLINGRIYIGKKQGTFTQSYLGSGTIITKAIVKYGKENFKIEVLGFATTDEMLDGLEQKYIYEYRQVFGKEFLYNLTDGGEGCKGFKHTKETKQALSDIHKNMKASQKTKIKMSLTRIGKKQSPEWIENRTKKLRGQKRSLELRKKLSKIHTGKILSDEHKNHTGESAKKVWAINGKEMAHKQQMTRLRNWIIEKYTINQ